MSNLPLIISSSFLALSILELIFSFKFYNQKIFKSKQTHSHRYTNISRYILLGFLLFLFTKKQKIFKILFVIYFIHILINWLLWSTLIYKRFDWRIWNVNLVNQNILKIQNRNFQILNILFDFVVTFMVFLQSRKIK